MIYHDFLNFFTETLPDRIVADYDEVINFATIKSFDTSKTFKDIFTEVKATGNMV